MKPTRAHSTVGGEITPRPRRAFAAMRRQAPHAAAAPAEAVKEKQPVRKVFTLTEDQEKPRTFWAKLQTPFIIILGVIGGVLVQSPQVGQALIAIYGIAALLLRIASRTTFTMALLALVTTVLMVVIENNSAVGQTFAGYTLLLFIVGILSATRELREQKLLTTKKRHSGRRY